MKKIVLVSMRIDEISNRKEKRDSIDQKLLTFIINCGYFPILVPNILFDLKSFEDWLVSLKPHSILLSGGNDLGENQERDKTEFILLTYALKNNIPLLGICRGMQFIAKEFGAKLIPIKGFINARDKLIGELNHKPLFFFNFGIANCPEGFYIIAKSSTGIIHGIKHKKFKLEGWMWHPEREKNFVREDINRIKEFFL